MLTKQQKNLLRCGPATTGKGIPVSIVSGFLGAGKTTLLRRWQFETATQNPVFLVSDLNGLGTDSQILLEHASLSDLGCDVIRIPGLHEMSNQTERNRAIESVFRDIGSRTPQPSHVFYEADGTARPWELITAVTKTDGFYLRHFMVMIDALNFHRDFFDGQVLTGEVGLLPDPALHFAAEIIAQQLLFASAIILTKTDTVPESAINTQVQVLQTLQPDATIGLSTLDGFSFSHLDVAPVPNLSKLLDCAKRFGLTGEDGKSGDIVAVAMQDPRPFHPQRLYEVFQKNLGTSIYRTKGFLWLVSRPDERLLWQQSGSQISFERSEAWTETTANTDVKPVRTVQLQKPNETALQHPVFGHRGNKLTVFGLTEGCTIFVASLGRALCTAEEIRAWQKGKAFPDPWPKTIHRVN